MKTIVYGTLLGLAVSCVVAMAAEDPFASFISPVSNPTNFEDPRPTTEIRAIYAYHSIDQDFVTGGGDAHVVAAQVRIALTDRIGFIATKDGYTWVRPKAPAAPHESGWADVALGFKGIIFQDLANRTAATFGLRYETASGNHDVYQGQGDGLLNPFLSGMWGTDRLHLMGYAGPRLALDGSDSSFFDMSLHADYRFENFYPLLEVNWIEVLDGGHRLPINQEGFDFYNLGAEDAGGTGVVTMAMGGRWRIIDDIELGGSRMGAIDFGTAFEFPISSRQDIFGWRITTDLIFRLDPGALL